MWFPTLFHRLSVTTFHRPEVADPEEIAETEKPRALGSGRGLGAATVCLQERDLPGVVGLL